MTKKERATMIAQIEDEVAEAIATWIEEEDVDGGHVTRALVRAIRDGEWRPSAGRKVMR